MGLLGQMLPVVKAGAALKCSFSCSCLVQFIRCLNKFTVPGQMPSNSSFDSRKCSRDVIS